MRYTIDTQSNSKFIQFFGSTETNAVNESPMAFQVRTSASLLVQLDAVLDEVTQRIKAVDAQFHSSAEARQAFECGFVVFRPGEVPVTCVVQRRSAVLLVGGHPFGDSPIDLPALHYAVKKALGLKQKKSEPA